MDYLAHSPGHLGRAPPHRGHHAMPARAERRGELAPDEPAAPEEQDAKAHAGPGAGGAPAGRLYRL